MNAPLGHPVLKERPFFDLPLPRTNEDHLDMCAAAGAAYGALLGERVALVRRIAIKCGLLGKNVRAYLEALTAAGLAAAAAAEGGAFARLGVGYEAALDGAMMVVALGDLNGTSQDLRRRGYRQNQVARFRVSAWRVFKLAIREATKTRAH